MTYVDTSVILAYLLSEPRRPGSALWLSRLVSSELLRYEVWVRLNSLGKAEELGAVAAASLRRVGVLGLEEAILRRALAPFPVPVRTLDALHLSTLDYVRRDVPGIRLATYDRRMRDAAIAMGIPLATAEVGP